MILSLLEEKLTHVIQQCQEVYFQPRISVLSLTKLIGLLSSTVRTILPGKAQFHFLQQEQISSLKKQGSYKGYVILGNLARQELLWWISNGRKIQQQEPQMTIKQMLSQKGGEHIAMESQQGEMVKERTGTPNKCFRTNGCKICNPDFPKKSLKFNYLYPDGQQNCPIESLENGGYAQSRAFKNQQVNLALSAISWDHNYCTIFTKQVECPSRLGVSECQGLRLETASEYVSEHNQTFWISNSGPLSIQAVPSTSAICSMETRSKQHSNRCNATVLGQIVSICFPPFSLIS